MVATPGIPEQDESLANNRAPNRGMKLDFISPVIKNGTPIACLQQDVVFHESSQWFTALILYVIGENPTMKYLTGFIERQWPWVENPEISFHDEAYFIIRFKTMAEKNEVLATGPSSLAKRPVLILNKQRVTRKPF